MLPWVAFTVASEQEKPKDSDDKFYDGQMIVITICNIFDLLRLFAYHTVPLFILNNIKVFVVRSLVMANLSPFHCRPRTNGEQYEQMMSVMRSVSYVYVPNTYHIITGMPEIEHGDDDDDNIYNSSSRLATTITVLM